MFSFSEYSGESDFDRRQRGSIEFQGEYVQRRKPAWFVLAKLAVVLLVIGFGYAVSLRHVPLPPLEMTGLYFGVVLLYCGLAYLIRPRPHDMNMGWAGGLINDPTQYSDNINRGLRDLECLLQPGQLATETLLDVLILFGVHRAYEPPSEADASPQSSKCEHVELPPPVSVTTGRVLSPDRFDG